MDMHTEMILIVVCAFMLVCFWRVALTLFLCAMVGVALLGLVTAMGYFMH